MNPLLQRWHALAPREQWLSCAVALLLPAMAWLLLGHDPLAQRLRLLDGERQCAAAAPTGARIRPAGPACTTLVRPVRAARSSSRIRGP